MLVQANFDAAHEALPETRKKKAAVFDDTPRMLVRNFRFLALTVDQQLTSLSLLLLHALSC
jgi:uncharacterized protein involved in cysteine biosynthesis